MQANSLLNRGGFALKLGRPIEATPSVLEGLVLAREINDRQWTFFALALAAWIAAEEGRAEHAGRLWGALEADADRTPVGQWELQRDEFATHVVSEKPEFEGGLEAGRRLSLDEAVEEALHSID